MNSDFSAARARLDAAEAKREEVLLREQGGWHQDRDLLVVLYCQERGTHRYFGFTEADVATDQAVHGQRLTHVAENGVNCLRLIRRGLKRETVAE